MICYTHILLYLVIPVMPSNFSTVLQCCLNFSIDIDQNTSYCGISLASHCMHSAVHALLQSLVILFFTALQLILFSIFLHRRSNNRVTLESISFWLDDNSVSDRHFLFYVDICSVFCIFITPKIHLYTTLCFYHIVDIFIFLTDCQPLVVKICFIRFWNLAQFQVEICHQPIDFVLLSEIVS